MSRKLSDVGRFFMPGFFALLACALQVQILIGANENYMGLRMNLADLFLPVAGLLVLVSLLQRKSEFPHWVLKYGHAFLSTLTLSVAGGLVVAFNHYGYVTNWALLNRGAGWLILLAYMYLGGWLFSNYREYAFVFLKGLIWFFFAVLVFEFLHYGGLELYYFLTESQGAYEQLSGLMGNRNAYIFLTICGTLIIFYLRRANTGAVPDLMLRILFFLLPLVAVYNGSRAGWIGLILITVLFLFKERAIFLKLILPSLIFSLLILTALYHFSAGDILKENQILKSQKALKGEGSDQARLIVGEDALELWSQHKMVGGGIGSFLIYQEEKRGEAIDQIDNSALWILTELGIVGAFLFGAFFIAVILSLIKKLKTVTDHQEKALVEAVIVIMFLFALFSLVHQIMYARYLWFLLGMALVATKRVTSSTAS